MVGLQSLAPGQAPMPGQAQMAGQPPMPGMMPGMMPRQQGTQRGVPALVPPLKQMELQDLIALLNTPQDKIPANLIIAAMTEKQKDMATRAASQRQMAMAQGQQQPMTVKDQVLQGAMQAARPPQMAAHGGVMHGYAGGGAVAFEEGGSTEDIQDDPSLPLMERIRRSRKRAELSRQQGIGKSFAERFPEVSTAAPEVSQTDTGDETARMLARKPPFTPPASRSMVPPETAALMQGQGPRWAAPTAPTPPRSAPIQAQAKPNTGLGALASAVEQTGTPAPDTLSSIEAEAKAQSEGLQRLLAAQGQVDPRIVAARKEAAELAQQSISAREKRAAGALEAAGMPLSQSLFDNQEALFRMLGAMKGGKRLGDAFSSIGQEAGAIRGEQRRALEAAQRENRLEQNALDQLRQAQADLKLAQTTGDVAGERTAALKVEEAKANLINTRLNIQKERSAEKDRVEGREIQRGQLAVQQQQARTAAAQASRDPEDIRIMRALGIPTTPEGFKTYAETKSGSRVTDFTRKLNIALEARIARGEPDNAATREAARMDVLRSEPAAQRVDLGRRKEAQAAVEKLLLMNPEYRKMKDKNEARRLAKIEAAREFGLSPADIPDPGATTPAAGAATPPLPPGFVPTR